MAARNGLNYFSTTVTNSVQAIAGAGGRQIFGYDLYNNNSAQAYVQIFNQIAANVVLGTTVPDLVIVLPANGGRNVSYQMRGISFSNALSVAVTSTRTGSSAMSNAADVSIFYL